MCNTGTASSKIVTSFVHMLDVVVMRSNAMIYKFGVDQIVSLELLLSIAC
jgi:hypothetical protein